MTEKLITIFVHDKITGKGNYGDDLASPYFGVKEHMTEYFKDGFKIKSINTIGGAGGCLSGWIIVHISDAPF